MGCSLCHVKNNLCNSSNKPDQRQSTDMAKTTSAKHRKSRLHTFFYRIHRFLVPKRARRKPSKVVSTEKQVYQQAEHDTTTHDQKDTKHMNPGVVSASDGPDAISMNPIKELRSLVGTPLQSPELPSPRHTRSLQIMPNLSTPSSSRRWKADVLKSMHINSPSLSALDLDPGPARAVKRRLYSRNGSKISLLKSDSIASPRLLSRDGSETAQNQTSRPQDLLLPIHLMLHARPKHCCFHKISFPRELLHLHQKIVHHQTIHFDQA